MSEKCPNCNSIGKLIDGNNNYILLYCDKCQEHFSPQSYSLDRDMLKRLQEVIKNEAFRKAIEEENFPTLEKLKKGFEDRKEKVKKVRAAMDKQQEPVGPDIWNMRFQEGN